MVEGEVAVGTAVWPGPTVGSAVDEGKAAGGTAPSVDGGGGSGVDEGMPAGGIAVGGMAVVGAAVATSAAIGVGVDGRAVAVGAAVVGGAVGATAAVGVGADGDVETGGWHAASEIIRPRPRNPAQAFIRLLAIRRCGPTHMARESTEC